MIYRAVLPAMRRWTGLLRAVALRAEGSGEEEQPWGPRRTALSEGGSWLQPERFPRQPGVRAADLVQPGEAARPGGAQRLHTPRPPRLPAGNAAVWSSCGCSVSPGEV